jgi:hypothetical protein
MFQVSTIKTLFDWKSQEKIHRFTAVQLLMKLKKNYEKNSKKNSLSQKEKRN